MRLQQRKATAHFACINVCRDPDVAIAIQRNLACLHGCKHTPPPSEPCTCMVTSLHLEIADSIAVLESKLHSCTFGLVARHASDAGTYLA